MNKINYLYCLGNIWNNIFKAYTSRIIRSGIFDTQPFYHTTYTISTNIIVSEYFILTLRKNDDTDKRKTKYYKTKRWISMYIYSHSHNIMCLIKSQKKNTNLPTNQQNMLKENSIILVKQQYLTLSSLLHIQQILEHIFICIIPVHANSQTDILYYIYTCIKSKNNKIHIILRNVINTYPFIIVFILNHRDFTNRKSWHDEKSHPFYFSTYNTHIFIKLDYRQKYKRRHLIRLRHAIIFINICI